MLGKSLRRSRRTTTMLAFAATVTLGGLSFAGPASAADEANGNTSILDATILGAPISNLLDPVLDPQTQNGDGTVSSSLLGSDVPNVTSGGYTVIGAPGAGFLSFDTADQNITIDQTTPANSTGNVKIAGLALDLGQALDGSPLQSAFTTLALKTGDLIANEDSTGASATIAGLTLEGTSPLVKAISTNVIAGLAPTSAVGGLLDDATTLIEGLPGAPNVNIDLQGIATGVLATPFSSGNGVTINPTTGTITLDLDKILGTSVTQPAPNTNLFSAANVTTITNAVNTALTAYNTYLKNKILDAVYATTVTFTPVAGIGLKGTTTIGQLFGVDATPMTLQSCVAILGCTGAISTVLSPVTTALAPISNNLANGVQAVINGVTSTAGTALATAFKSLDIVSNVTLNDQRGPSDVTALHANVLGASTADLRIANVTLNLDTTITTAPLPLIPSSGTLIIHKYQTPSTSLPADGTEQTVSNTPIDGVTFTVKKVLTDAVGNPIDLTTATGWKRAAALSADAVLTDPDVTFGPSMTDVTAGGGLAQFDNLFGLYLVEETNTPAGVVPAEPFLVTVPLTSPDGTTWMDTVNVYPKNSQVIVTKTVNDTSAVKVSDHVTWTILGDVQPDLTLSSYAITDQLDPRLTYANATVDLTGPGAGTLTSPGDYTISESGGLVTVEFTAAGLTKLEAAAHDGETKVQVVIDTVVNAPGEIPNDATMFINDPGMTSGVQVDTIPETDFGQAEFAKMAFGTTTPLPGAEFRVYATKADAASGDNPLFGQTSFTSNSAGLVVVDGLKYGTYWLAESKAPDGYELMVEPVQFTVDQQADGTADFTVYDVKSNAGFTLPSVGGQRWILPTVAAIAAAGLLALMTVRRRRSA